MPDPKDAQFQLIRQLGSGRTGDVWLAQQRTRGGISRLVAVKLLHEEYEDGSDAVNRLRDEGQVLAMLQHPNILGFHDITRIDDRLALVTEFVEGTDLAQIVGRGERLPPRVAVDIAARVASALEWAQTTSNPRTGRPLNLIHRNIKPGNIQLSDQGAVKILDFGMARSTEMERHAKTRMGEVLGTPGYAAPEALAFQVASPAGDVYSLGCTLYELLVGEPFFHGRSLPDQALLALQSRDYGDFLAERLMKVEHPDSKVLLDEMLAYAPENRPRAGTVCDVCEDQVRQMEGPTFPEWNRRRTARATEPDAVLQSSSGHTSSGPSPLLVASVVAVSFGMLACGFSALGLALWYVLG